MTREFTPIDYGAAPGGRRRVLLAAAALVAASGLLAAATIDPAAAQDGKKPNILFIMADDIGWFNIGAYHRGMMAGETPHLDKLAAEGMLFNSYYAEASCTAGRANFITGELPMRTGLTTVGQAGATVGMPAQAPTIATVLKTIGLHHRPVRQEPPRRSQRIPADGPRLRRVLGLSLSSRRDGGPLPSQLSAESEGPGRATQPPPHPRDRRRRSDRRSALGQGR